MAVTDNERLMVLVEARITDLERNMRKASSTTGREFGRMRRDSRSATRTMENDVIRSTNRINHALAATSARVGAFSRNAIAGAGRNIAVGVGATAAAYFSVQGARQIGEYADAYRGLQNQLKDAGREGEELTKTFGSLFRISQDQGAALGSLVGLYRDAAAAGEVLNATESDRLEFAKGVANALRIEGKSAQEAAGPLQQLGQLLAAGTVRAEEFNSVNEGTRPILQAVADGLEEAGGSIATLRKLVLDGKLTSEAFFRAFLAGSNNLAERADKASSRVGQSYNRIGNAMTVLVGHIDEVSNASGTAASRLDEVADVIEALPGYIDAAVSGMANLRRYLNDLGNHPIFGKINEMLGIAEMTPDELRAMGINPAAGTTSTTPDGRIAQAFDATQGTGIPEGVVAAGKAGRVIGEGAQQAKVSLEDFASSVDEAAKKAEQGPAPIETARQYIGLAEGRDADILSNLFKQAGHNVDPKITAWCAAFVNAVLATNGLPGTGKLNAQSFLDYGEATSKPEQGDIVVLKRGTQAWQGHVGFFDGYDARGGIRVLGGNQKDSVNVQTFKQEDVMGYRRIPGVATGGAPGSNVSDIISQRIDAEEAARDAITRAREDALAEQQRLAESYDGLRSRGEEFITMQDVERQGLSMTSVEASKLRYEQEMLNEAQRAGIELTAQQREEISQLAARMANAEHATVQFSDSQKEAAARAAEFQNFAKDGLKGFISDLQAGKDAGEALAGVLDKIASKLIDMAIDNLFENAFSGSSGGSDGGGFLSGIGSILGSLFGGGRASGGAVREGEFYRVGEKGEEWFAPGRSGTIIPNHKLPQPKAIMVPPASTSAGGTNGSGSVHVTVGVSVDNNGKLQAYVKNVAKSEADRSSASAVRDYDKRVLPDSFARIQADPRAR